MERFTIPCTLALVYFILTLHGNDRKLLIEYIPDYVHKISAYAFLWFFGFKLFTESRGWSLAKYFTIGAALFLPIGLYVYAEDNYYPLIFLGSAFTLFSVVAPFLKRDFEPFDLYVFICSLLKQFFLASFATIILVAGGSAIASAVRALFGIHLDHIITENLFFFTALVFYPFCFLAGIPETFKAEEERNYGFKGLVFLLSYIAIPLLSIYLVILYGYAIKLAVIGSLPKGTIVYLVSGFTLTGIIVYFLSFALSERKPIIHFFNAYFFKLLFVPLVLLMIAIFMRIKAYGITEDRYLVVLCFIWLVTSMLVSLSRYKEKLPQFILISLAGLLFIASFGFWGAVGLSTNSQMHRLETVLKENNLLVNGKIQVASDDLSFEAEQKISSGFEYIIERHREDLLKPLFSEIKDALILEDREFQTFHVKEILADINVEYQNRYSIDHLKQDIYFSLGNRGAEWRTITLKGYDYWLNFPIFNETSDAYIKNIEADGLSIEVRFDKEQNRLLLKEKKTETKFSFDLKDAVKQLERTNRFPMVKQGYYINEKGETPFYETEQKNKKLSAKIIIHSISGMHDKKYKHLKINALELSVLVRTH